MTPTEHALRLLLPGVALRWPAQPDPTQPWLRPAPVERTVREVHGREIVFDDGTRLALPPDPQLRLASTTDDSGTSLTLSQPPNPPLTLTISDPLHREPVLSMDALRRRCQAGAWIEITRHDKQPGLRGKVRWATGFTTLDGHPAIVFADRTALALPKKAQDLHFHDDRPSGNRVHWQAREGSWISGPMPVYYSHEIRFRNDLPAPRDVATAGRRV